MKTTLVLLITAAVIFSQSGCSTRATFGNRDQHGAAVSAKTTGMDKGVRARVY